MPAHPVRVLLSTPAPRDGVDNPFIRLSADSLPDEVDVRFFTWSSFVVGSFDVFHVQWPEQLLRARGPVRRQLRAVLLLVLLARIRLRGRRIVRTVHNLTPHDFTPGMLARVALTRLDADTDYWIYLNAERASPRNEPSATILHGHYRDWFADQPRADAEPGRLLCFGHVRRYKGVDALLAVCGELADAGVHLQIAGRPADPHLADELLAAAEHLPIELTLRRVPDAELVTLITRAEAVILPYRDMYNSGALLLALSLGRPVVVPASPSTATIADEVGPGWVVTYEGPLSADAVLGCLEQIRTRRTTAVPDLSARDWPALARRTTAVYAGQVP